MEDIICPQCNKAFKVDEAGYADILKQVRNSEFEHELHERLELAAKDKENAIELAKEKAAEAYVKSENADVIKSYTHLCDESAARCLTYFKEMDIVMPGLRVLSTDCAQSLGVFHKRNLQIDSLAKISACGLAELSMKQGTINGLNSKEWCVENSHLAAS